MLRLQPQPELQHVEDSCDRASVPQAQSQGSQMGNHSTSTSRPHVSGQSDIKWLHSQPPLWAASGDGSGIPARQLLQRIKWATVGPPYDWTERIYDPATPYRPLQKFAAAAALRISGLVGDHLSGASAATHKSGSLQGRTEGPKRLHDITSAPPGSCTDQPADRLRSRPHSESTGSLAQEDPSLCHEQAAAPVLQCSHEEDDDAAACTSQRCSQSQQSGPFVPNAALVCFYRAGDTLCGHQDDAEADLSQVCCTQHLITGCK